MSWKQALGVLQKYLDTIAKIAFYVSLVITVVGYFSGFFQWGNRGFFAYVASHWQILALWTASIAVVVLWLRTSRLERRFASEFRDNFDGDLRAKWDYSGPWRIPEKGVLLVGGAQTPDEDGGGITKMGAQWENYEFSFEARIMKECLGVIVRAKDRNNYHMFQIRLDAVKPHRRIEVPVTEVDQPPQGLAFASADETHADTGHRVILRPVHVLVGWDTSYEAVALNRQPDGWFKMKVVVEGEAAKIYIDDELVFHQDTILRIPTGKVGFRNNGAEAALVRHVRVKLLQ